MYTATERFSDASALLSYIESRTVREGRRAFAWQLAMQARRTRRERIIEYITTTFAAVAWVACVMVTSGMLFIVGTE
jgi:hypothetical protein|nr:MAG TPA: hypothetical protein [Caudoviricetes sp.]